MEKTLHRYLKLRSRSLQLVLFCLLLASCRDDLEVFEIERLGTFSFSTDNINTVFANDVNFYRGKVALYYYDANTYEVYNRYLLEARGTSESGNAIIISIEIDLVPDGDFIGTYRPTYESNVGGIHSFSLLEEVSSGSYVSYSLDPEFLSEIYLQVQRQSVQESLIQGNFFAVLDNDQNSAEKITLYEGTFKDISYAN